MTLPIVPGHQRTTDIYTISQPTSYDHYILIRQTVKYLFTEDLYNVIFFLSFTYPWMALVVCKTFIPSPLIYHWVGVNEGIKVSSTLLSLSIHL